MRKMLFACAAAFALASPAYADRTVELKPQIQIAGPAVTLGDVFVDAGDMGARAVAPAPAAGTRATFSARFLSAAAAAAGLSWTPPDGMDRVTVWRTASVARLQNASFSPSRASDGAASPLVRRGDTVTLVYVAPGLQLTTRAKAMADAGMGQPVRLMNMQSNKPVDAVVTGPGAASANGSF